MLRDYSKTNSCGEFLVDNLQISIKRRNIDQSILTAIDYTLNRITLGCTSQEMPCGMYIRRRADENFTREYPGPLSSTATDWLANLEHDQGLEIRHARNSGEFRVGTRQIPVDGYCK